MMVAIGWIRTLLSPSIIPEEAGCSRLCGVLGGAPSPQPGAASVVEVVEC
jgi:hypothetical protein